MHNLIVASAESNPGLLQALGIDGKLLVEQAIAFLILVAILGKFVYPALVKAIEARREQIEAGMQEAKQAEEALANAEARVADMLSDARKEADDIIARSHQEATSMVADAEEKAKNRAEQIVADARTQLDADVRKAREALKSETIKLVALATEQVVKEKLDVKKDANLIKNALGTEKA
ncbi:MAG TPA: F0F1 ATP synthase subunit B [Candidatus Saccharimonadales bacterium]|nr:F0F1 ATP synthase subunit B [Candidatus Saccharimonadales bacterium]